MASGISTMNTRQFFTLLAEQRLPEAGIGDPEVMSYVADLLDRTSYRRGTDNPVFHADTLFDMLKARDGFKDPSIRAVADTNIGDHALIKSGLFFDESTNRPYYAHCGSSSYGNVRDFYIRKGKKPLASLFDCMSYCFDGCVHALNKMREHDIFIERKNDYDLLIMPKDRRTAENMMLDAMIMWKKIQKN